MNDYRLIVKVKNNLLYELMNRNEIKTQSELARAIGASPTDVGKVANLRVGAFNADGEPSKITKQMCEYFCCFPEEIYPPEVLHVGLPKNIIEKVVSSEEVAKYLTQQELNPMFLIEKESINDYMNNIIIKKLNTQQQKVIKMRFFEGSTLEEAANKLDLTRERIRQIEKKAVRKLKEIIGDDAGAFIDVSKGLEQ
jgi:RNA polymerase sigma factor (sigma-70 family)